MPDPYNPWATPIFPGASAFGVGSPAEDAQRQPTIVDNLLSHIAGALGRGFMAPGQALQSTTPITSEQMIAPAQDMSTAMSTGAGAMPASANELRMGIKAYHGSPHDFERFDLSKIGTGEGAQAYGHGLYFADSEGVAKSYRDALSGMNVNGKHLTTGDADHLFMDAARNAAPIDQRSADLISTHITESLKGGHDLGQLRTDLLAQKGNDPNFAKALDAALGQAATATKHPGKMYEVNINADPAHFLDWDKPLSQQADTVKQALKLGELPSKPTPEETAAVFKKAKELGVPANTLPEYKALEARMDSANANAWQSFGVNPSNVHIRPEDMTGAQLYQAWEQGKLGPHQLTDARSPAVADRLREAGIPGIKYLDQGSRPNIGQVDMFRQQLATLESRGASQAAIENVKRNLVEAEKGISSNYVVFNDKLIDIIRKYAIPGMFGAPIFANAIGEQKS